MPRRAFVSLDFWAGAGLLVLLTLPFVFTDLDLSISSAFYHGGRFAEDAQPWRFLYRYGTLPGLLAGVWALCAWLGSAWLPALKRHRRQAAVVLLTLLLGPGLLVNVLGKGYWGRPRPRDTVVFGGQQPFHRILQPGTPGRGKSFPSGHPSVGYLFCAFFFLDSARRRRWLWLGGGLAYGTLMGVGRIAQGAHFASDVLWSGGLTYLSAAIAQRALPIRSPLWSEDAPAASPASRRWLARVVLPVSLALLSVFFLLATPYYKEWKGALPGQTGLTAVRLTLPPGPETVRILHARQREAVAVRAGLQGFGFPKLRLDGRLRSHVQGTTLTASLDLDLRGWVTERGGEIDWQVREDLQVVAEASGPDIFLLVPDPAAPNRYTRIRVDPGRPMLIGRPVK